jgi:DNA-binding response OmpR family regulator
MRHGKKYVLLVEDEILVAMMMVDALRELGFEVHESSSAVGALKAAKDGDNVFELAVVDLGLPDRPGDQLIADLKALHPGLPIIVTSGQSSATAESVVKNLTGINILPKPYVFGSLRDVIVSLGLIADE